MQKIRISGLTENSFYPHPSMGVFSHRKAIEEFVTNSKSDWLLVLEDDVMFDDRLSDLLSNHVDGLPTNNIYVLGGQDGLSSINRVLFGGSFGGKYKFKKSIMKTHRWIYRTCCYLIHKNHANELLSLMKRKHTLLITGGL